MFKLVEGSLTGRCTVERHCFAKQGMQRHGRLGVSMKVFAVITRDAERFLCFRVSESSIAGDEGNPEA